MKCWIGSDLQRSLGPPESNRRRVDVQERKDVIRGRKENSRTEGERKIQGDRERLGHTGSLMLWSNSLGKTAPVTACLRCLVLSEALAGEEN